MKTLQRQVTTVVGVALLGLAGGAVAVEKKQVAAAVPAKTFVQKSKSIALQLPRERLQEIIPDVVIESEKASFAEKPRLELRASASDLPRAGMARDGKHLTLEYPVDSGSSLKIGLQSDLSIDWSTRW
ncbi:MAG: hypothetical protein HY272_10815 [Gammaproteobacteria bacterium]|nr:hypothetical protein [Gammaproteobacteria bacterium]